MSFFFYFNITFDIMYLFLLFIFFVYMYLKNILQKLKNIRNIFFRKYYKKNIKLYNANKKNAKST